MLADKMMFFCFKFALFFFCFSSYLFGGPKCILGSFSRYGKKVIGILTEITLDL